MLTSVHAIHAHVWQVITSERDAFGTVRLVGCTCGAQRCDSRPAAA